MTSYKHAHAIQTDNMQYIESKVKSLIKNSEDSELLESEIISLLVSSLCKHGKDENQIRQIAQISKILSESLGLGIEFCQTLEQAARIYDIGNLAISDEIYKKDNKLTFEEFTLVKNHTLVGYTFLKSLDFPSMQLGAIISAEHHEWWNAGGYPRQLKEDEINIASRIVAVADTVGALYRKRPGRNVWQYDSIIEYIKTRSGLQYDPEVVNVFCINRGIIHEVLDIDLEEITHKWYE